MEIKALEILAETAKDFVQKVITPPLEEVGGLLADNIKVWRFKNQVNILAKAEAHLKSKNIKTKKVSLKILAPMLEQCSIEEDEGLQNRWAALIANTVSEGSNIETTLFSHILSQLSVDDVRLLDIIYNASSKSHKTEQFSIAFKENTIFSAENLQAYLKNNLITIDNLIRLRLIKEYNYYPQVGNEKIALTDLGFQFVIACKFS
jgi:hypothetical protein